LAAAPARPAVRDDHDHRWHAQATEDRVQNILDRRDPPLSVGFRLDVTRGRITKRVEQVRRGIPAIRGLVAGRQIDEHIPLARIAQEIAGEVEAVQPRMHDHVFLPWAGSGRWQAKRDLGRALLSSYEIVVGRLVVGNR
jgi:hypothetical protein